MLEVADRAVGLRAVEAVDRTIVVAPAGKLALDVVDDLAGRARCRRRGRAARRRDRHRRGGANRRRRRHRLGAPLRRRRRVGAGAGGTLWVVANGCTGAGAALNIGAGWASGCMNNALARIAAAATAATTKATASRALHPSVRSRRGAPSITASNAAFLPRAARLIRLCTFPHRVCCRFAPGEERRDGAGAAGGDAGCIDESSWSSIEAGRPTSRARPAVRTRPPYWLARWCQRALKRTLRARRRTRVSGFFSPRRVAPATDPFGRNGEWSVAAAAGNLRRVVPAARPPAARLSAAFGPSCQFAAIRFKCGSIDFSENTALILVKFGEKAHGMTNRRFNADC